jgi:hypothetical protein
MERLRATTPRRTAVVAGSGGSNDGARQLQLVIPYTTSELTRTALDAAPKLARELDAEATLIAVHVVPFPCPLDRPTVDPDCLRRKLLAVAKSAAIPVRAVLVYARDWETGFQRVLKPGSLILVATNRRVWRTAEEKLARRLALAGHSVAVLSV